MNADDPVPWSDLDPSVYTNVVFGICDVHDFNICSISSFHVIFGANKHDLRVEL